MISCQACGHSNPLGRVFCQKCGTKLDLSKVRPPGSAPEEGGITVGVTRDDKSKKKTALKTAVRIFDVLLVLAVGFGIYLVWQVPDVKSPGTSSLEAATLKGQREKLEFAMSNKKPYKIEFNDMTLNSYLNTISDMGKSSNEGAFRTKRIYLVSENDLIDVVSVREIVIGGWTKDIVMQYRGRPIVDGEDFRFQRVSGAIGKLPVPSFALGLLEKNYARLFQDFQSERALLGKLSEIQLEPNKIALVYEPTK